MDVIVTVFCSWMFVYSFSAFATAEIEYISPEQQQKLESQFNNAAFDPSQDMRKLQTHEWTCDMYGARSHMQVQHDLKLYKWSTSSSAPGEWRNSGAQLVSDYKSADSRLIGRKDRFEDQVKMTKDGLLVSRLSLNSPHQTVLAYSVCKIL
jgi:hypothetical protein